MSYEQIFENVKELHKINFNEIISVKNYSDSFSPVNTGYHDYKFELLGCCHKCEEATCNGVSSDSKERENGYKCKKYCKQLRDRFHICLRKFYSS